MEKIRDWRNAQANDVVFRGTHPNGETYEITREEFDRVVDVFALLRKWDLELRAREQISVTKTPELKGPPITESKNRESKLIERRVLSERDTATYLGVSRSWLAQTRMEGKRKNRLPPPPYVRLGGRRVGYLIDDLDEWLKNNRHAP